jgi:hypothetical protein
MSKAIKKQINADNKKARASVPEPGANQLAADMQDIWHYAHRILMTGQSTFDGDREHKGLQGRCAAYGSMRDKLNAWDNAGLPELKEFDRLQEYPEDEVQLVNETQRALRKVEEIERKYGIDARGGEFTELVED